MMTLPMGILYLVSNEVKHQIESYLFNWYEPIPASLCLFSFSSQSNNTLRKIQFQLWRQIEKGIDIEIGIRT